jgi:hypothetical protein
MNNPSFVFEKSAHRTRRAKLRIELPNSARVRAGTCAPRARERSWRVRGRLGGEAARNAQHATGGPSPRRRLPSRAPATGKANQAGRKRACARARARIAHKRRLMCMHAPTDTRKETHTHAHAHTRAYTSKGARTPTQPKINKTRPGARTDVRAGRSTHTRTSMTRT